MPERSEYSDAISEVDSEANMLFEFRLHIRFPKTGRGFRSFAASSPVRRVSPRSGSRLDRLEITIGVLVEVRNSGSPSRLRVYLADTYLAGFDVTSSGRTSRRAKKAYKGRFADGTEGYSLWKGRAGKRTSRHTGVNRTNWYRISRDYYLP